jgi:hypothetical protein
MKSRSSVASSLDSLTPMGQELLRRREFLDRTVTGLSAVALTSLLDGERLLASESAEIEIEQTRPHAPRTGHYPAKAKRVLVIFCAGACSQLETYDFKPELIKRDGQPLVGGPAVTFQGPSGDLARPQYAFRQHGESGKMVSDMIPHLAGLVDDIAFIHSLTSKSNTHGPAENFLSTGFVLDGFPSMGAWATYALGTENQELPAFVAIPDPRGVPQASVNNWGPGFLPAVFQGTPFSSTQPIQNLRPPAYISPSSDHAARQLLQTLNREHLERFPGDSELAARIASYELAAKMQLSVPSISDLSTETAGTLRMYGADSPNETKASFARNCLLARRLLESGVRFVQLFNGAYASAGSTSTGTATKSSASSTTSTGRSSTSPPPPSFATLKQRGLLDDTLVVWCTEFGRMPMFQKGAAGRDHNPQGFTAWLGGSRESSRESAYGATDEVGIQGRRERAVRPRPARHHPAPPGAGPHERLTFRHNGLDRRLTDVHGHVIQADPGLSRPARFRQTLLPAGGQFLQDEFVVFAVTDEPKRSALLARRPRSEPRGTPPASAEETGPPTPSAPRPLARRARRFPALTTRLILDPVESRDERSAAGDIFLADDESGAHHIVAKDTGSDGQSLDESSFSRAECAIEGHRRLRWQPSCQQVPQAAPLPVRRRPALPRHSSDPLPCEIACKTLPLPIASSILLPARSHPGRACSSEVHVPENSPSGRTGWEAKSPVFAKRPTCCVASDAETSTCDIRGVPGPWFREIAQGEPRCLTK